MSYSVNFYGHKDFDTPEEVEAFELDVIARVTEFANGLPGLGGGTVNTSTQEQAVLHASDGADTNADGSPVAVTDTATDPEAADAAEDGAEKAVVTTDTAKNSASGAPPLATLTDEELAAELERRKANPPA